MIRGLLNPEKILGNVDGNPKAFQKFMLGKNPTLTSIASKTAVNNIVKFNAPNVKPESGNSNLVLSNISTNILNTVNNSLTSYVSGVSSSVNNIISSLQSQFVGLKSQFQDGFVNVIRQVGEDYRKRLTELENRSPKRILDSFLKLYENAIGFINFFGDQKNISKIGQKLKRLKIIFNDSFEVAKVIRQTISRIVKQLTSLPQASASGGSGLNIDIDVPGGALRRSGGSKLGSMMKMGGKLALGALGVAGLGMGVNALASALTPAKEYQKQKLEESKAMRAEPPSIFDQIAETFTRAVDKFTSIIEQAFDQPKGPKSGTSGSSSSSPSSSSGPPAGPPGGLTPPTGDTVSGVENTKLSGVFSKYPAISSLLQTIQVAEGTAKEGQDPYRTLFGGGQFDDLSKHPDKVISGGGYKSAAAGAYQFMPGTWAAVAAKKNLKDFSPASQDIGAVEKILERTGISSYDELEQLLKKEGFSKNISNILSPEWASFPTLSGKSYYGQPVKPYEDLLGIYTRGLNLPTSTSTSTAKPTTESLQSTSPPPSLPPSPSSTIHPKLIPPPSTQSNPSKPSIATSTGRVISSAVTEAILNNPIPTSPSTEGTKAEKPSYISVPETNVIDATANTQGSGGGTVISPPDESPSPTVPFLSASNPDNFHVFLSALTLNLVNR